MKANLGKFLKWLKWLMTDVAGEVNIGGIMLMGLAMVFLSIGFIFMSIMLTSSASLLTYVYSANASINASLFTGYTSIVGITPLLILVGYLVATVVTGFLGISIMKGEGSARGALNPGSLMLMGLSVVFISLGLLFEPIALDGVSSMLHGGGRGINPAFTGFSSIVLMSPLLVHVGFLIGSTISGFFGISLMRKGANN